MREGWDTKKLCELFEIKPSKNEARSKLSDDDEVSFLPMEDLEVFGKEVKATKYKRLGDVISSYTYFADNDVLLAKITPCFENGKLGIARSLKNGVGFGSSEYVVFRSKQEVIPEFLFYSLAQESFRDEGKKSMTGAVGHKRVSKEFIENYLLSFPKLRSEQKRLVEILNEASAAIDKAKANVEKNLQNAKELFESYLQSVFTKKGNDWKESSLKELTTKIGSGATPRGGQESYKLEGISLVRSMNVYDWEFREKNLAFIDVKQAKELDGVTLQEEDVLLNITGASVARCCVFPKKYLPARVNQHVSIIRPKKEVLDAKFLNLLLTSKPYKDQLLFTGEQGATRQAITKVQIEAFRISFPKLKDQQIIVHKLDALRTETQRLGTIYQNKLENLEQLKKSILQKAFTGELPAKALLDED